MDRIQTTTGQSLILVPGQRVRIAEWNQRDDAQLRAMVWPDWQGMLKRSFDRSGWSDYIAFPLLYRVSWTTGKSASYEGGTYPYLPGAPSPLDELQHSVCPAFGAFRDVVARHVLLDLFLHPDAPTDMLVSGSIAHVPSVPTTPVLERLTSGAAALLVPPGKTAFRVAYDSGAELVQFSEPDFSTVRKSFLAPTAVDWTPIPNECPYVVQDTVSFSAGDKVYIEFA